MSIKKSLSLFILAVLSNSLIYAQEANTVSVIPYPQQVKLFPDEYFESDQALRIAFIDVDKELEVYYRSLLGETLGYLPEVSKTKGEGHIILRLVKKSSNLKTESYTLTVRANGIEINAIDQKGLFYGLQTLRQLLWSSNITDKGTSIQFMEINDWPRFKWRAFMLDEARFFKGKQHVMELMDEMALLKMNVFHWHLTDDPGWRIEIKKYPLLTEVGSKRSNSQIGPLKWSSPLRTGEPHEGFYTQEEIKEIVEYAAERNIVIIPEIDMPGHSSSAIAAYPWLGTRNMKMEVMDYFGQAPDIFDVTKPEVYKFLTDVLDEIMELFPSEVIHIGGDEVPFDIWRKSKTIKSYMSDNDINSMGDLQIDFNNKISRYLESKGRRLMGWNDILGDQLHGYTASEDHKIEKTLADNTIVHFWKGSLSLATNAAERGYDIVNSLHTATYLDYSYQSISLDKAYSFDPIPEGLDPKYHKHIIGTGCQMWGEWIPTVGEMEFMVYPRIAAYAEVGWTETENMNYDRFIVSINAFYDRWKKKGFDIAPMEDANPAKEPIFDITKAPSPLFRDPVFDGTADPSIIWDSNRREWLVFYTQRRANRILKGVEYCYGTAIGMASSADNGETWQYRGVSKLPQPDKGHNTFWAPHVRYDDETGLYHMFVTYIKGIYSDWGGDRVLLHYESSDLRSWTQVKSVGTAGCIDASVFKIQDGKWKMWYKNEHKGSYTYSSESDDLYNWTELPDAEVTNRHHEAPVVFFWRGKYWMITDPTYLKNMGLDVHVSDDGSNWTYNSTILTDFGLRPDDNSEGRHADVLINRDRAYIFYFTHPGREYDKDGKQIMEPGQVRFQRSSLQVAELEFDKGKIICKRDKYLLSNPHER